jgi:hypothetical protein
LIESIEADGREDAMIYVGAWLGEATAADNLTLLTTNDPYDLDHLGWAARVAARSSSDVQATTYRRLAELIAARGSARGYDVAVRQLAGSADEVVSRSLFLGTYSYRRDLPWHPFLGANAITVRF